MDNQQPLHRRMKVHSIIQAILIGLAIGGFLVYILGIYKPSSIPCEKCGVLVNRKTPRWHYVFHKEVCNRWFWSCQDHNHRIVECSKGHKVALCIPERVKRHQENCGFPDTDEAIQAIRQHEERIYPQVDPEKPSSSSQEAQDDR